ncbi:MAG: hypothetical protein IPJ65_02525 [Archangiaceae bacterium]|nr:hypothetical protein [Archangiaceae bacterium]
MSLLRSIALATALCGCGAQVAPTADAGTTFIAFASHFNGYADWESFALPGGIAQGSSHLAGDRVIYLNHRPPAGATEFPVGTIIVKTTQSQIFGMVKRGGNYNADGAVNWEWFELEGSSAQTYIRWRGLGPPDGETYGGPGNSGCNNCHSGAWDNDFVQAEPLKLAGLAKK